MALPSTPWIVAGVLALGLVACGGGSGGGKKPRPRSDLAITSFSHTVVGTTVRYTVVVQNLGPKRAEDFNVDIYYDPPLPPPPKFFGDETVRRVNLDPGASRSIDFVRPATPLGTYDSYAQVDADTFENDPDRSNNVAGPERVVIGNPGVRDLTVTSLTATVTGLDVEYTMVVENLGDDPTGPFWVDLYHDLPAAPAVGQTGDDFFSISSLAAMSSITISRTRAGATPGSESAWVQVDALQLLPESDETNNVTGPTAVVIAAPGTPELVVEGFSATPSGSDITYDVTVRNVGAIDAGPFDVDLYLDRPSAPAAGVPGDVSAPIAGLAAGTSTPLQFVVLGAPAGIYDSWVLVDSADAVAETSETNNDAGPVRVEVGAELEIAFFRVDLVGGDAFYTVVVENFGTAPAGPFFLDLYYDQAQSPAPFDFGDDFANPTMLDPGTQIVTVFQEVAPAGDHISWAQVDTDDLVAEIDEGNNIIGPFLFDPDDTASPDLEVTGITPTVAGSTITYDIDLENLGASAADDFFVDVYLDRRVFPKPRDFDSSASQSVTTLGAAGSIQIQVPVTAPSGTYLSWVQVDTDEAIPESNDANNVLGPVIVVVP